MKVKDDEKFEQELNCRFKIGIRNMMSFDSSTRKTQKSPLYWTDFDQSI